MQDRGQHSLQDKARQLREAAISRRFSWPRKPDVSLPKLDLQPDVEEGGLIADVVRVGSLGFGFSAGGETYYCRQCIARASDSRLCVDRMNSRVGGYARVRRPPKLLTNTEQSQSCEQLLCTGMLFPYYIGVLEGLQGLGLATGEPCYPSKYNL